MHLRNLAITSILAASSASVLAQAAPDKPAAEAPKAAVEEPKKKIWENSIALGLTLTKGNSDTLMLNGNIQSVAKWDKNELNLGADGNYGESEGTKNAESLRAYGQYNRLFTEKLFGYFRAEGLYDGIADVDYRFTLSPGAGYYFIKTADTQLRGEVGPGYVFEKQGGVEDDYLTLRLAERYDQKFNERVKIWQTLEYLPEVEDFNNYIINGEIGLEVALSKKLSERTFLQDTYHSRPAAGRDQNDLKLVAALAYKF